MKSLFIAGALALSLALGGPTVAAATPATTATPSPSGQPLAVASSSLTQHGAQLVWTLQLQHSFSPARLNPDGRTLCLLFERAANGSIASQLCVIGPPGKHGPPRVSYMRVSAHGLGPAHVVDATISRTSTSNLTATFLPADVGLAYAPLRWQVISTLRPPACVPATPDPNGCVALYPAAPTLITLRNPLPVGCTVGGAPFVYHGPTNRKVVALTFDDGPWPDTPQFLDILEREHAVATFFEIGDQVAPYGQHGAIERRMLLDGDMIGDHTWNHPDVAGAGAFAAGEIARAAAAIRQASGFTPCLFRAPYGDVSPALTSEARSMGFTTIQWNVDPQDWALPGVNAIVDNVVANARDGSIIIQHDGGGNRSETIAALPREIDALRREGYQFETVTQLLGYKLIYK